ncbi:MAG: hypothetical protein GY720_01010 [bacterium]|nr:hypothetical protein [bacterium]
MRSRFIDYVLYVLCAAVLATACGASSDADTGVASLATSSTGDVTETTERGDDDALLEFAACMRANGVPDFRDPTVDAEGKVDFPDKASNKGDNIAAAYEVCAPALEGTVLSVDKSGADITEYIDSLYELAVCMREQGLDFPDPDPVSGSFGDVDKDDPAFDAAYEACGSKLGAGK